MKKTALFIVDPLGSVDYLTTIDAHGYGGIGYIGWTGMYYFFGGRPQTYAPTTTGINAKLSCVIREFITVLKLPAQEM